MKKVIYSIYPLVMLLLMMSCASNDNVGFKESNPAVNFRMTADLTQVNLLDDAARVNLIMYSENTNIDNVTIIVEALRDDVLSDRRVLKVIPGSELKADGSNKFSLSIDELGAPLGLTKADLNGGDSFTIYNVVTLDDGRVYPDTLVLTDATGTKTVINLGNVFTGVGGTTSYTSSLKFTMVCPSAIPVGEYSAVSTGTSTDGCPPTNPLNNYPYEVTITKTGPTTYSISDIFAGVYINWYGDCYGYDFETPAAFADVCNEVVIGFTDGFGSVVVGTGAYDPGTGVITYTWENDFGDTGTTTLTPQ